MTRGECDCKRKLKVFGTRCSVDLRPGGGEGRGEGGKIYTSGVGGASYFSSEGCNLARVSFEAEVSQVHKSADYLGIDTAAAQQERFSHTRVFSVVMEARPATLAFNTW